MPGVIRLKVAASEESVTLRSASGSLAVEAVSPHVAFERVTGGTKMTVTDVDGEQSVVIPDGEAGDDGFSPTVTITEIEGGHRITITDKSGAHTADVMDGDGGGSGGSAVSPTATVVKSGNTATITITDKNGTTTASISDGADGADGVTFTPSVSNEGVISWTNDGGKTNPQSVSIKGPKGDAGDDYVLTAQDKADIAAEVSEMLVETVSGTTPTIAGVANHRYMCGELASLTATFPASGIVDIVFASGTTPTVLDVSESIKWPDGFDPTALKADVIYELNVMNGIYGAVGVWR